MEEMDIDYNQEVLIRCGYCGTLWTLFPHRVMYLGECHCGNDNYGRPNKWKDYNFGDFDFIGELKPNLVQLLGFHSPLMNPSRKSSLE